MASVIKKINKKANRFKKALEVLEKHLAAEAAKEGSIIPVNFDLKSSVEEEIKNNIEQKRKDRNKRKASKR